MGTYLLVTPKEDELYHFGIKGMKWGIRRFQPYQAGEHVKGGKEVGAATKVKQRPSSGNIVEKYKAHQASKKKAAAVKKAQATRKAKIDFENEKKKAIESGSVEDLAKFKGKLTNEEYQRAFMRLQNEKKVADMVAANQKTVWDKIDKGIAIVAKVGGYANTVATAKENINKLDDALHKKEKEAAKEKATAEKNKFITNIENITELNRGMDKYKLTPQEYQSAMNILRNKKLARGKGDDVDEDFVDQDRKAAKEKAAKDQADRDKWTAEQNWKQYQKRQAKEAKRKEKEAKGQPKDGTWREDNPSSNSSSGNSKANTNTNPNSSQATARTTPNMNSSGPSKPTAQLLLGMRDSKPSETAVNSGKRVISGAKSAGSNTTYKQQYDFDFGDIRYRKFSAKPSTPSEASSGKRVISGAKSAGSNTTYKQQANLDFGGSKVSRFSAKPSTPSKVVTDTRQTVANTQAERARQKEVDKKRKAKIK